VFGGRLFFAGFVWFPPIFRIRSLRLGTLITAGVTFPIMYRNYITTMGAPILLRLTLQKLIHTALLNNLQVLNKTYTITYPIELV
jgi:hypothetical protein